MKKGYSINIGASILDQSEYKKYQLLNLDVTGMNNTGSRDAACMMKDIAKSYNLEILPDLTGENAKRGNVIDTLKNIKFNDNDFLFFSFSGHGGSRQNKDFIFLNDSILTENEILYSLASIDKEINIFLVLDCCNAEGIIDDENNTIINASTMGLLYEKYIKTESKNQIQLSKSIGPVASASGYIARILFFGASERKEIQKVRNGYLSHFSQKFSEALKEKPDSYTEFFDRIYQKIMCLGITLPPVSLPVKRQVTVKNFESDSPFSF